jgi:hypothetical protein
MAYFAELSTCRGISQGGVHPIPFDAMDSFAGRYLMSGQEFESLRAIIRAVDASYLEHFAEEMKAKLNQPKARRK